MLCPVILIMGPAGFAAAYWGASEGFANQQRLLSEPLAKQHIFISYKYIIRG